MQIKYKGKYNHFTTINSHEFKKKKKNYRELIGLLYFTQHPKNGNPTYCHADRERILDNQPQLIREIGKCFSQLPVHLLGFYCLMISDLTVTTCTTVFCHFSAWIFFGILDLRTTCLDQLTVDTHLTVVFLCGWQKIAHNSFPFLFFLKKPTNTGHTAHTYSSTSLWGIMAQI